MTDEPYLRQIEWESCDQPITLGVSQPIDPSTWAADGTQVLKDGESRVVPIQPSLAGVLVVWQETEGDQGLVCKPLRQGRRRFLDDHTMGSYLREALTQLKLAKPGLGWYECTRHTMASHFVMSGGSLETLRRILGHSTVLVTERYSHLRPGDFNIADRNRLTADFGTGKGKLANQLASEGVPVRLRKRIKAA